MPKAITIGLQAALVLATMGHVVQAYRIHVLGRQIHELTRAHTLQVGETVPPLTSLTLDGELVTIVGDRPPKPVIVYWMSPDCSWCVRNEANFRAVVAAARAEYDVVAVSARSDGLAAFVRGSAPPYTVVEPPMPEAIASYKFAATPMTMVIGRDRRVTQVWNGVYDGENRAEVEAFFRTSLPGLLR
jgi:peroxiredoxin